jgi:hypothetical protein
MGFYANKYGILYFAHSIPAIRIRFCLPSCFFNLNKLFLPPQVDVLTVGPTLGLNNSRFTSRRQNILGQGKSTHTSLSDAIIKIQLFKQ